MLATETIARDWSSRDWSGAIEKNSKLAKEAGFSFFKSFMNPTAAAGAAGETGKGAAPTTTTMDREQRPGANVNSSSVVGKERQSRGEESVASKGGETGKQDVNKMKEGGVGGHFSDNESDGGKDSRDTGCIDSPLRVSKAVQHTTSASATDAVQTSAPITTITPPAAPVATVKADSDIGAVASVVSAAVSVPAPVSVPVSVSASSTADETKEEKDSPEKSGGKVGGKDAVNIPPTTSSGRLAGDSDKKDEYVTSSS